MAMRIECARVNEVGVRVVEPGTEIGCDVLDNHALVLHADSVIVLEGTLDALRRFAAEVTKEVWA